MTNHYMPTYDDSLPNDDRYPSERDAFDWEEFLGPEGDEEPMTLDCWECGGWAPNPPVPQKVVKLGAVVFPADPTQSYILECGHTTI